MDFVVVGFGLGALSVLLGVVLLGWAVRRAERAAARATAPDGAARDLALAAERRSAGRAFLYAGGALLLATIGALAGSLDDRTGAYFVVTTATVAALGILFSGYLHRSRHPVPARLRPQRRVDPAPATGTLPLLARQDLPAIADAGSWARAPDRADNSGEAMARDVPEGAGAEPSALAADEPGLALPPAEPAEPAETDNGHAAANRLGPEPAMSDERVPARAAIGGNGTSAAADGDDAARSIPGDGEDAP